VARARRMRHRRRSTSRKLEHRQWFTTTGRFDANVTLAAGADSDNVIKFAVDALKGDDQTVLRTRGIVYIEGAAFTASVMAVLGGIVLPNKVAQDVSNSDLPNPLVDADTTDWFVWQPFAIPPSLSDSGSETGAESMAAPLNMPVDSKAKRIIEASESVVWCMGFNAPGAQSAKNVKIGYVLRCLVGY